LPEPSLNGAGRCLPTASRAPRIVAFSILFSLFLALFPGSVAAQQRSLGVFGTWGAFADEGRCYAISAPDPAAASRPWRPFASIGDWPGRHIAGQLHIRLSRAARPGSAVLLRIDGRVFQLVGGGADAWAPDAAADAQIANAMRTGIEMSVETRAEGGQTIRDRYHLRGAATAMDAAAIACAPRSARP
jgi:hypothetical protein